MTSEDVWHRIRELKCGNVERDTAILDSVVNLNEVSEIADAARLLFDIPADRLVQAGREDSRLKVAVIGTFATDGLLPLVRLALLSSNLTPRFYVAGLNKVQDELRDPESGLARFDPDITILVLHDGAFLPQPCDTDNPDALHQDLMQRVDVLEESLADFSARSRGTILLNTVALSALEYYSIISRRSRCRLGVSWREMNSRILGLADGRRNVCVIDLEMLLVNKPVELRDERLYRYASMAWSADVEWFFALELAKLCRSLAGLAKKVLVVDLDGVLWGGVLGEDGPAGIILGDEYPGNCYRDVQNRIRALGRQGVVLAMCSKNEMKLVEEVMTTHPGVRLPREAFAASAVGWDSKENGLRQISEILGLPTDSFVFVDDSSFECNLIRYALPATTVVQLSGDPANYAMYILAGQYFDVAEVTEADTRRSESYVANAERQWSARSFASREDYLVSLKMSVNVRPADKFMLSRLAQLRLRTNQFRMVPETYAKVNMRKSYATSDTILLGFEVADRFGDDGLVGGVWISCQADGWHIDNLVMSCRVLGRGVEYAVLQDVVNRALSADVMVLHGWFRQGERNVLASSVYATAGFKRCAEKEGFVHYRIDLRPQPRVSPGWIKLSSEGGSGLHCSVLAEE